MSSTLKQNIQNLIKSHKKTNGNIDKNILMPLILLMIISYCDIDQNKYHILSSYGIRGIKEVGDLDINMDANEWKKLTKSGMGKAGIYNGQMRYFITLPSIGKDAEMEIFAKQPTEGFPDSSFSHKKLKRKFLRDDFGHLYYHLDTLVKWKKEVHREKDQKQLKLLVKELKKLKRSKSGMEVLKTMGLTTVTQVDNMLVKINKILQNW